MLTKKKKSTGILQKLSTMGTVSKHEIVEFTRHLSVMLGAGVTIFDTMVFLMEQCKNKVFAAKLNTIVKSLNNGMSLSAAMHKFPSLFPSVYVNIVRVGEESGTLCKTTADLAEHMEETEQFKRRVKGALIYPKIILSVMGVFMVILALFVLPKILTIFTSMGAEIPTPTRILISSTKFVNQHVFVMFLMIAGLVASVILSMRIPRVRRWRDKLYLKMPFVGKIVLNYNTAQVSQHFGTLFSSGIPILRCLEITQSVVGNSVFEEEVGYMINRIQNGASFSQSFPDKSVFPPMFVKMIRVGERTGKLPHVVDYMKTYYKGLVDNDVRNITSIIEPVIMILLGIMVAGLVITVIGPIYKLISNVGTKTN